jgi:4-hydroxy-tetrahydrodipicolinate synthase
MLSLETNPGPVKAAMEMLGKKVGKVRLPLATLDAKNTEALRKVLVDFGLL